MNDLVQVLEAWYASNCDGDWEHQFGVRIESLDNPGWSVDINLEGTSLDRKEFSARRIERSSSDWLDCRVDATTFKGRGGPSNLGEILSTFVEWARS